MLEYKCQNPLHDCDSSINGETPKELSDWIMKWSWMHVRIDDCDMFTCPKCADEVATARKVVVGSSGFVMVPEEDKVVAIVMLTAHKVDAFARTPPGMVENAAYVAKKKAEAGGEPVWFYSKDGDCIFAYWENVPTYGDRLNGSLTIYRAVDDNRVIGCQVKGVEKEMK